MSTRPYAFFGGNIAFLNFSRSSGSFLRRGTRISSSRSFNSFAYSRCLTSACRFSASLRDNLNRSSSVKQPSRGYRTKTKLTACTSSQGSCKFYRYIVRNRESASCRDASFCDRGPICGMARNNTAFGRAVAGV